jgi:transposase
VGSTAQVTETCEPDLPHLLLQVLPTAACVSDQTMTALLWADLAARELEPGTQVMDMGYVDAQGLVDAAARGIDLVGPIQPDTSWQARAGAGYAAADFALDWEAKQATCPQGKVSRTWVPKTDSGGRAVLYVRFARSDCAACPVRPACTRSAQGPRTLMLLPTQALHEARQAALARQETAAFREQYACRAGIEGTISQVMHLGGRRARYRGEEKLRVQSSAEAAAVNVVRLVNWRAGVPRASTRRSHLARVLAAA